jgi:integrase
MQDMPRPRPKWLQKHTTRHGNTAWYVRVKRGPLIRIKAEYGTDEFDAEYRAAIAGAPPPKSVASSGTLQWLYDRYRESVKWTSLSEATRRQRANILSHVMAKSGSEPFAAIDSSDIEAGKDARRGTPAQARNFLDAMKGLFRWAKANNHIETDPTAGVETPRRPRNSPGFHVWDDNDVTAYRAKWPLGTRQRVWMELLLGTGLRRGDAVRAGKMHVKEGVLTMDTEKTGMTVHTVVSPGLQAVLERGPTAPFHFICGMSGKPLTKESFGNMFKVACREAGLGTKKSAHGLRKLAVTRLAEAGYSDKELEATFGWTGGYMASLYTRSANRKHLAVEAAKRSMVLPEIPGVLPEKIHSTIKDLQAQKGGLVRSRKVP